MLVEKVSDLASEAAMRHRALTPLTDTPYGGIEWVADVRYFLRQLEPGLLVYSQEDPVWLGQRSFGEMMDDLRWRLVVIESLKSAPLLAHAVDRLEEKGKAGKADFHDLTLLTFLVENLMPHAMVRQIAKRYAHLERTSPIGQTVKLAIVIGD
jgi:hypothetical protein